MNLEPTGLLGITCLLVGLVVAFLFLVRRRAARRSTTLAQATNDLEAKLELFRSETDSRIAELGEAINKLKFECAATNIQLVSLAAQTDGALAAAKALSLRQEDTWTRRENPVNISIVPRAIESADNDTWVRDEGEPEAVESPRNAAPLATVISEGRKAKTR
jgi:hypothetical protein